MLGTTSVFVGHVQKSFSAVRRTQRSLPFARLLEDPIIMCCHRSLAAAGVQFLITLLTTDGTAFLTSIDYRR